MTSDKKKAKTFCIYLWPDETGLPRKIWKYTFKWRPFLLNIFLLSILASALVFLFFDYGRLKVASFKQRYLLAQMGSSQYELSREKNLLTSMLTQFQTRSAEDGKYRKRIEKKLGKLQDLIRQLEDLGLVYSNSKGTASKSAGIGGAETDCSGGSPEGEDSAKGSCKKVSTTPKFTKKNISFYSNTEGSLTAQEFPEMFDRLEDYVGLLAKVPLAVPVTARISSNYGFRRSPFSKRQRMHHGIDFAGSYGSPVQATGSGVIKTVKWDRYYGRFVDVDHGYGIVTRYAHLSKTLVKPGQKISLGTELGKIGSSGQSTGAHLHYEVRINGNSINPKGLFEVGKELAALLVV